MSVAVIIDDLMHVPITFGFHTQYIRFPHSRTLIEYSRDKISIVRYVGSGKSLKGSIPIVVWLENLITGRRTIKSKYCNKSDYYSLTPCLSTFSHLLVMHSASAATFSFISSFFVAVSGFHTLTRTQYIFGALALHTWVLNARFLSSCRPGWRRRLRSI